MSSNCSRHKHLYPIIDAMIDEAIDDLREEGVAVSCRVGCTHCCHLLIEIAWEEALELAEWVEAQPPQRAAELRKRIKSASAEAKLFFRRKPESAEFAGPVVTTDDIPEDVFDDYFYEKKRPCPFLEADRCIAYEVRPSPCRLHMVTSPPELCAFDVDDDSDYEIPDRLEQLKEAAGPVASAVQRDPRWGHLAIMVESALAQREAQQGSDRAVCMRQAL